MQMKTSYQIFIEYHFTVTKESILITNVKDKRITDIHKVCTMMFIN